MSEKTKNALSFTAYAVLFIGWGLYAMSGYPLPKCLSHVPVFNVVASGMFSFVAGVVMLWGLYEVIKNQ